MDVAGHGAEQVPKVTYLSGWLTGLARSLTVVPRLESLVDDFEKELVRAVVRAAWFSAIVAPREGLPNQVDYQGIVRRFPEPLLCVGAPVRTVPATGRQGEVQHHILSGTWRLAVTSDGLLRRLGRGNEQVGREHIADWQTGVRRNEPPLTILATNAPLVDDELYADVTWDRWDSYARFDIDDYAEMHRVKRLLSQESAGIVIAASEALANVRRHAYRGRNGPVTVYWRDEGGQFRVEVEDNGSGQPPLKEGRGFAIMRKLADSVDVRGNEATGMTVSIVRKKGEG
ncbi:MAG TPA: ATP-binding protein [Polyangiaceae bacterium]|nr:ATP-binding protein [Polyangiaceae bacterium]